MTTNWLLLRGLAREQRHWRDFRDRFAARMGGANVHCVDVAGTGTEHEVRPRASVRWMAGDVARRVPGLSGALRADERWSVVGLSLGGMLALELCRMFPRELEVAVIVNASSRLTSASARLRPKGAFQLLRAACSADPLRRERLILALTSSLPGTERERHARRAAELARDAPTTRMAVLAQLIAASRFAPPACGMLRARLRFICSRQDQLVSPRCSRDLAAWFGRGCDEHPWAGHDLPLDDPDWLCDRIARLAEPEGAAATPRGGTGLG
jgi:pimeloyl-[acyl-carrier protein] methyl ester esterase